jgi:CDP-glucose 4,6-dehydratase
MADVNTCVRCITADLRDYSRLSTAMSDFRPDVVLHMAAQSVVRKGYDDPMETYSTNVLGTAHVFEAVRKLQRPCVVINVTTDKCYQNNEWVWGYRENDPLGGRDPYSNSKACAELVAAAYGTSFFQASGNSGVSIGCVRAGNVVGGGDWTANQLVPDLVRSFLNGEPCLIRNPRAIRPWQFVLEPLRGYLLAVEHLANCPSESTSAWNFGPESADAWPVSRIADTLCGLWGDEAAWCTDEAAHPHEADCLRLDITKARVELNWEPLLRLDQTLGLVVAWYRAFRDGARLRDVTEAQIASYTAMPRSDASGS